MAPYIRLFLLIFIFSNGARAYKTEGRRGSANIEDRRQETFTFEYVLAQLIYKMEQDKRLRSISMQNRSISSLIHNENVQIYIRKLSNDDLQKMRSLIGSAAGMSEVETQNLVLDLNRPATSSRRNLSQILGLGQLMVTREQSIDGKVLINEALGESCIIGCLCNFSCRRKTIDEIRKLYMINGSRNGKGAIDNRQSKSIN